MTTHNDEGWLMQTFPSAVVHCSAMHVSSELSPTPPVQTTKTVGFKPNGFKPKGFKPLFRAAAWGAIPLTLLLFAQWPLRDLVQAYSRPVNDLGQIVFALYAAFAITAASVAGAHLSAHSSAHLAVHTGKPITTHYARARTLWLAVCVLPWGAWMLWASAPMLWQSLSQLEKFPETLTPGFFFIKVAAVLAVGLIVIHALRLALGAPAHDTAA